MSWLVLVEGDLSNQFAMRTHVLELCRALAKFEMVQLVSQTPDSGFSESSPLQTYRLPARNFRPHNLAQMVNTLTAYLDLKKMSGPADTIYIRLTAYGLGPLLFARRRHIPSIVEVNGIWDDEQALSRRSLPRWKRLLVTPVQNLRGWSLHLACRFADQVVAVTPQISAFLKTQGIAPEKIKVVHNGVNPDHFSPMERFQARQELGLPAEGPIIGFVGSLVAWQGVNLLIEAFASLPTGESPPPKLLIVGDGPERRGLEKLARELGCARQVHFFGYQPYVRIPLFIASCDVLAVPKRPLQSGYSTLKVYEALAGARPVIASRLPGLEIIEDARAGFLFNAADIHDLQKKLAQMLSLTGAQRRQLGENGRAWVLANATWEHTAKSIHQMINR